MTPLVEAALQAITSRTNLSSGLAHPNDMNAAKEMFVRLREAGEMLLGAEISTWGVMNGWKLKDAHGLGTLAADIGAGKRVRITDGPWWKDDILDNLRAGAN